MPESRSGLKIDKLQFPKVHAFAGGNATIVFESNPNEASEERKSDYNNITEDEEEKAEEPSLEAPRNE